MKDFTFNKDIEKAKKLVELTIKNDGYCLCQVPKSEDTKCPCKNFIENKECICNMFVKDGDKGNGR